MGVGETRMLRNGMQCGGLALTGTEERRTLKNWARDHSCDIVVKNLASFCLYSENPSEVKVFHREAPCTALGDQRNALKAKQHHPEDPP